MGIHWTSTGLPFLREFHRKICTIYGQNHDVTIRTNKEAIQLYKWLEGANDAEFTFLPGGRVNDTLDWSFDGIKLFRNGKIEAIY